MVGGLDFDSLGELLTVCLSVASPGIRSHVRLHSLFVVLGCKSLVSFRLESVSHSDMTFSSRDECISHSEPSLKKRGLSVGNKQ